MWWEEGLRFTCLGCGRCCRGEPGAIYFTPEEEAAMAAFLGTGTEESGTATSPAGGAPRA